MTWRPWREAWDAALYGPDGFYRRQAPQQHFRTAAASAVFAAAVRELAGRVDDALGRPDPFDVVDLGAGRAELLQALPDVPRRWRLTAVEVAPDAGLPGVRWKHAVPELTGLLLAHEWLDAVPLDVVDDGRLVLVAPDGEERPGPTAPPELLAWAHRWWPGAGRVEVGLCRDAAWTAAARQVRRGLAVAVDYGHTAADRRPTLTGYRDGRQVRPVPDGSCDLTAHIALDSLGGAVLDQRTALRLLGVDAGLPTWDGDAAAYARDLQRATAAATLLDPAGAGGFGWAVRPVGVRSPLPLPVPA